MKTTNARVKLAKTGHCPHCSKLVVVCVVLLLFVLFYILFVCKCVLYYCHWVSTQLQLINISYQLLLMGTDTQSICCFCHILIKMGMFAQVLVKVLIRNFIKRKPPGGRIHCDFNITLQGCEQIKNVCVLCRSC